MYHRLVVRIEHSQSLTFILPISTSTLPCLSLSSSPLLFSILPYQFLSHHTMPHLTILYPTLPYPILPYPISTLPYPTLPYPTLSLPYPTLPYLTLPYSTLPYLTLPYLPTLPLQVKKPPITVAFVWESRSFAGFGLRQLTLLHNYRVVGGVPPGLSLLISLYFSICHLHLSYFLFMYTTHHILVATDHLSLITCHHYTITMSYYTTVLVPNTTITLATYTMLTPVTDIISVTICLTVITDHVSSHTMILHCVAYLMCCYSALYYFASLCFATSCYYFVYCIASSYFVSLTASWSHHPYIFSDFIFTVYSL